MKQYLELTKSGIIVFVVLSGLAGYAISLPLGQRVDLWPLSLLLIGLYLLSAGSFSLNQAQEWRVDRLMPRTSQRPVASGQFAPWQAYAIGFIFCPLGLLSLNAVSGAAAIIGLITLVLYNGFYTLHWKKRFPFAAVPGALPGAMPITIGYAVNSEKIFSPGSVYLFLVMFLWQMPHFWCLALRYKEDYKKGGVPVLPLEVGTSNTLYHIGLYTIAYVGLAIAAPMFVKTHILYLLIMLPFALKLIVEYIRFSRADVEKSWFPFFMWVNFSLLAFILVPVFDKWLLYWVVT